jgi:4-hydroxy-3-methylbut-2-enyl diphosphate reductase IspH
LLKQILRQLDTIPSSVQSEYDNLKMGPHDIKLDRETCESMLKSSVQEFEKQSSNPVFILLDAYDEFVNTKGSEEKERNELRCFLVELCARTSSTRILITTRPQHIAKLKETFCGSQTTEILGDVYDIEQYLRERVKDEERINRPLKDRITSTIIEANRKDTW